MAKQLLRSLLLLRVEAAYVTKLIVGRMVVARNLLCSGRGLRMRLTDTRELLSRISQRIFMIACYSTEFAKLRALLPWMPQSLHEPPNVVAISEIATHKFNHSADLLSNLGVNQKININQFKYWILRHRHSNVEAHHLSIPEEI